MGGRPLVPDVKVVRGVRAAGRAVQYQVQRATGLGFDADLEDRLRTHAREYLDGRGPICEPVPTRHLDTVELQNNARFAIARHDVYRRFDTEIDAGDVDHFGRPGRWVPRGTTVYFDRHARSYVKVFDAYTAARGEARYLRDAVDRGLYTFLCPNLDYVITDDSGLVRGYSIREGTQLTRYEFERYIGGALREVILVETARTNLYFYDLEYHNVIKSDGRVSVIDLESILPIAWFATGDDYAMEHFDELDVGWSLRSKWRSPDWYDGYLAATTSRDRSSVHYSH